MIANYSSIIELLDAFPNEQACIDHLRWLRWGDTVVSPFDETSTVYECRNNRFRCRNTKKYFNVTTKTMFEGTKVLLRKWFLAIWLVTSHKKGISSVQLAKDIKVTQKTAWFMLHRIRKCFEIENKGELSGEVEMDETFVGGKNKNRHKNKKVPKCQGRAYIDKTPVLGMLQRGGKVIARKVASTSAKHLLPEILKYVKSGTVYTDEWVGYADMDKFYQHRVVDHAAKQYVDGDATTNRIEGFWSIIKRGIIGIYHYTSRKYLQYYVNEFVFRYNTREMGEGERFNMLLSNMEYSRLTHKQLTHG